MLGLWALYRHASPARLDNALERFALPLGDVPPLGSVALSCDPGRDLSLDEGADLVVRVRATGPAGQPAPSLVWQDGGRSVAMEAPVGETVVLAGDGANSFITRFPQVRRSFAFRVFCADSCTRSVVVTVVPLPRLASSLVALTPPAYLGLPASTIPGPPAGITAQAGAQLHLTVTLDRSVPALTWRLGESSVPMQGDGRRWEGTLVAGGAGDCDLLLGSRLLVHGLVQFVPDAPPEVRLLGADDNRLLLPGARLPLEVQASDDHGLQAAGLLVHDADAGDHAPEATLQAWRYLAPPGPSSSDEHWTLVLDPQRFLAGHNYVLTAVARDCCPANALARSRPVVLRIRTLEGITALDPALAGPVARLQQAIVRQRDALGMSDNLAPDLDQAIAGGRLAAHRDAIAQLQHLAQEAGQAAEDAFGNAGDQLTAHALAPLVGGEMPRVFGDLARLTDAGGQAGAGAREITRRQQAILDALIALLGEAAGRQPANAKAAPAISDAPERSDAEAVDKALAELKDVVREQERILARTRSLMDAKPLDLSDASAAVTGELAREEAAAAKYLEEHMTDFSKLPTQDFADGSLGKEINQVWQDITEADESLYKKSVEMAVPQEQQGLELAKELENNLEKWMSNHRDNVQWKMEEALAPADVPISELPKDLEDIVGDLLDKEDEMGKDVEDFSSAWMDNIDKGAGWDASDGPISSMGAKGITGNQLPNQDEMGGRSGEGRNGRSHGQMVQDTAEGKGGRETPSRLEPEPFEAGSVKDSAKGDQGGPTGGGKVSGYASEGLRGPVPPPLAQSMVRLAGKQASIRQEAGALALELRRRHLASGDVENAVQAMQGLEDAAKASQGGAIHQRFAAAIDALSSASHGLSDAPARVRHERIDLTHLHRDLSQGGSEGVPAGYEEMTSAYFKALAAQGQ